MLRRHSGIILLALAAAGIGGALGWWGWPDPDIPDRGFVLAGLMLAAAVAGAIAVRPPVGDDWTIAPPSRLLEFVALLFVGRDVATLVAVTAALASVVEDDRGGRRWTHAVSAVATAAASVQAAGYAYAAFGGAPHPPAWSMQAMPIAVAILAYCAVAGFAAEIVAPLLAKRSVGRTWPRRILLGCANTAIAAAIAAGLVEILQRQWWDALPVAVVLLGLAYFKY